MTVATVEEAWRLLEREAPELLLERVSAMLPPVLRDPAWRKTRMGQDCDRYLRWKRNEDGAAEATILNRESLLYRLATDYAHLGLSDFEGQEGATMLREFLDLHWGESKPSTRTNRTSVLRDVFAWAYRENMVRDDPMRRIRTPRRRGARRDAHSKAEVLQLISAQTRERDRLALSLLGREGFRKTELRLLQLGHFDFQARTVSIFGKGAKFAVVEPYPDILDLANRYCQERAAANPKWWRREYLLHPRRAIRRGTWPLYAWDTDEYRERPMAGSTMQTWWRQRLEQAGIDPFPMHELRHTAATIFHLQVGDYELTRQFLRHENIATTAAYVHVPNPHVTAAKSRVDWREDSAR